MAKNPFEKGKVPADAKGKPPKDAVRPADKKKLAKKKARGR